jgi:hypothetical protein
VQPNLNFIEASMNAATQLRLQLLAIGITPLPATRNK